MKALWEKYREPVAYLFFGVLTTVVNYIVYFAATRLLHIHYLPSTVLSWIIAVLFAFFTNRKWVFDSQASSAGEKRSEFIKFVGGRLLSLALEAAIMVIGMDWLHLEQYDWAVKTVAQVFVVLFNYVLSKFFIFQTK